MPHFAMIPVVMYSFGLVFAVPGGAVAGEPWCTSVAHSTVTLGSLKNPVSPRGRFTEIVSRVALAQIRQQAGQRTVIIVQNGLPIDVGEIVEHTVCQVQYRVLTRV